MKDTHTPAVRGVLSFMGGGFIRSGMGTGAPLLHTHAAILSIGDELASGQTLDTNSMWLSARLMDLGVETIEHVTITDDRRVTTNTLRRLCDRAPLVIVTGGLGPTADDLTREAVADLVGEALVVDARAMGELEAKFTARGRALGDNQRAQALRPASARCLDNPLGTAPGIAVRVPRSQAADGAHAASDVFCLPGPPGELRPMFERLIAPVLVTEPGVVVKARVLHMIGIGEGDAARKAGDLLRRDRSPLVGITASGAVVSWRLRYRGQAAGAEAELDSTEAALRHATGEFIFGEGEATVASVVIDALRCRGESVGVVESCTGGVLAQHLTDVPGASDVFVGGLVTYANAMKQALAGVDAGLLAKHGAVSKEVAVAMAMGGLKALGTSHCLSVTGIAGPGGGSADKPVGTVWIARASRAHAHLADARRFVIPGSREDVRVRSARSALGMLWFALAGRAAGEPVMLFERPQGLG